MDKSKWIWMPHPAHYILRWRCQFRLATYVGGYIVSTVGEQVPGDTKVKDTSTAIFSVDFESFTKDDEFYESMVFETIKTDNDCCPYKMKAGSELEIKYYKTSSEAVAGHNELCEKWSGNL